ncbi:MAG: hypothetical protein ACPGYV_11530 [Phycisphaeraceae bacterium]
MVQQTDERIAAIFSAEAGKPLKRAKKQPPLGKGRGPYVRGYSFSIVGFAAKCLYLGERIDEANAALVENAQFYLDHPLTIIDRDSMHWHADVVMRLIEMYGTKGSVKPGLISPATEAKCLEPIWIYVDRCSWPSLYEYEASQTWQSHCSENHHAMHFTVCWHFAKLAKDRPEYRDRVYRHGGTAAEHYEAWSAYFPVYCLERARKGICVEMMSVGYNATMMKALYNFYDFGTPAIREAAGNLLDLYFAYWAQEQINGMVGGGKSRVYFGKGLNPRGSHCMAWIYFGIGDQPRLNGHDVNPYLSRYRPPAVIADIALDHEGRGRYEVFQRVQGLGVQGHTFPKMDAHDQPSSKLNTDGGGILRYTYCDPSFIIGTPMHEPRPLDDWIGISSQNRWHGVVFPGDDGARIIPIARPRDSWRAKNAQWSVQAKGTLVAQKLKSHKGAAEMIVWLSKEGLTEPIERDGVIFVESDGAYAAVRVAKGGYQWGDPTFTSNTATGQRKVRIGRVVVPDDAYAPVIVEVMSKRDAGSLTRFANLVLANKPRIEDGVLSYTSVYGDRLTFDIKQKSTPTINGKPIDYEPKRVYDSPFLQADYNSGVVTIRKGERQRVLDFNLR